MTSECLDILITAIEDGVDDDKRDLAICEAMTKLVALYPNSYWETPAGRRLMPIWDDYSNAVQAELDRQVAEAEVGMV